MNAKGTSGHQADIGATEQGLFQIGDLHVDVGRCLVRREGEPIPLTRLSFDLLLALIRIAPNILSHELMLERVWPGVVVSPETVTQRVKVLRDALGDDARKPRYIEGIRGRGYRLVPEVIPASPLDIPRGSASQAAAFLTTAVPESAERSLHVRWLFFLIAVLLLGTAIAVVLYRGHGQQMRTQVVVQRKPVTVSAPPANSVAVLPFENLSTAPNGRILALGMSEAVLHQLANLHQLKVIARTSSFAFQDTNLDAREIAGKLNARYLLEGSVQSDRLRLRVTAQLIDAGTGNHVWSIRFDRTPQDVFSVQDEIAQAVAQAFQLSLAGQTRSDVTASRTRNVEAWLAFQQGRALIGTRKSADLATAKGRFAEALRIDPNFAGAYVRMAEAYVTEGYLRQSEFWLSTRPALSDHDQAEVGHLLAHALTLDPTNGDAYLVRAWQENDDAKAQPDYERGLRLSPNNAAGYAHFARLLFRSRGKDADDFDPAKREAALAMIDRARELDPLAPGHHLIKALMVDYGRSDWKQAIELSLQALAQDPNYYPALMKLAEFKWAGAGELAEAARFAEQGLAIEPRALWLRHLLSRIYLDLRDFDSARAVIEERHEPDVAGHIPLEMYRRHWLQIEQLAPKIDTNIPGDFDILFMGTVRAALVTGRLDSVRRSVDENDVGLKWDSHGEPVFSQSDFSKEGRVLLGRILMAMGEVDRGQRVLRAALREMDHDAFDLGRGDYWFDSSRAEALAALGDSEGALEALRRGCATAFMYDLWYRLEDETAYARIRGDPRFEALLDSQRRRVDRERKLLASMRAQGLIPIHNTAGHQ
jgi:TolB-like protein/DNA-binding winged helix-turn-helix (wHTH) protein